MTPGTLIDFWRAAGRERWFRKDEAFDAEFRDRFLAWHEAASRGELAGWHSTADGALALVLLLDQFPRNAFRDTPRMYATDAGARTAATTAIEAGFDRQIDPDLRGFFYLPFMHSEELVDLQRCVVLMQPLGGEQVRYAVHHRDIVERYGRFPHRNRVLGRESTPDELRFLAEGGFSG